MGQCEDDIKIPFPVVHSVLIRSECISCIFWLVERQIRDKKLQLKCGWCVKMTSQITPYNLYSRGRMGNHQLENHWPESISRHVHVRSSSGGTPWSPHLLPPLTGAQDAGLKLTSEESWKLHLASQWRAVSGHQALVRGIKRLTRLNWWSFIQFMRKLGPFLSDK